MAEMGKKRVKTTTSMADEDRISKLPDTVIVHILSFLPTVDVVRTCILSRRWKFMWFSVPTLSFSDATADFQWPGALEKFYKYVDNCLENRRRIMYYIVDSAVITRFKLEMRYFYQTSRSVLIDKWLAFAIKNRVKELYLSLNFSFEDDVTYYYWLPETVVNSRYLTTLELDGFDLDTAYSIRLPALKTLSLKDVVFEENNVVVKFLLGCPSLEKLVLSSSYYNFVGHPLRLQSLSLKFMKIKYDGLDVVPLEVEAMKLETLVVKGLIFENTKLLACTAIRNLSLSFDCTNQDTSLLEYVISKLPLLENLTLKNCYYLKVEHIKISNQQLKILNLKNKYSYEKDYGMNFIIESAPKLVSVCYEGNTNFSITMEPSNLLKGKFVILKQHENYDANWFTKMMNLFLNLNCSWNVVTLHVPSDKLDSSNLLSGNYKTS
ncbi:FBD-associated F-box protein At2g26860-like isoform X2 [Humulus lupulus]|uniref:FBD-associated F-box protein At2g26860-like isoform X2 n=1 Tax=Humulus lupulus TaxID=3486 RepID=UPI002B412648|nr:FBD-associated F-box protein At2g26860-like isoform X2 [Humulus lupulus]XP_062091723.1 FBD-associated F-box protein At2g26860-like isoform X2 [Humulus lupulus]